MQLYNLAADVAKEVERRHIVKNAAAMNLREKEIALASYQYTITKKLAEFLDEATVEVNRCSNMKEIEEIELLRESLMDSVEFEDIQRPAKAFC